MCSVIAIFSDEGFFSIADSLETWGGGVVVGGCGLRLAVNRKLKIDKLLLLERKDKT